MKLAVQDLGDEVIVAEADLDECTLNKTTIFNFAAHRRIEEAWILPPVGNVHDDGARPAEQHGPQPFLARGVVGIAFRCRSVRNRIGLREARAQGTGEPAPQQRDHAPHALLVPHELPLHLALLALPDDVVVATRQPGAPAGGEHAVDVVGVEARLHPDAVGVLVPLREI